MATLFIDNTAYDVKDGQNLLEACLSLGFDLPYFCWHPALGAVGSCRQCAVKLFHDEHDKKGRIVMSCMVPVVDQMRISIKDPEARSFRAKVIEWLMVNHPHDCPVCDEGGECHLQDMTVMTGHDYRRYRFTKRTHNNQDLGPFINHEMNRCIQCYRCVRYYRDYAGGRDLNVFSAHDNVYFGRQQDGTLESPFSGNLVEVCPTGVFTDKTLKQHYTRPWDMQTAPSVCVHCGLGCNTLPGERYGMLRRVRNRYNGAVNGYFLCDRGRYGYEFVNADTRIRQPLQKNKDGELEAVSPEAATALLSEWIGDGSRAIGIGSPRASLESNFALRQRVGAQRFFTGLSEAQMEPLQAIYDILKTGPARSLSLKDLGEADAILILGEDVANTAPLAALRLRQASRVQPMEIAKRLRIPPWDDNAVRNAVQDDRGPMYIASPAGTGLNYLATRAVQTTPDDIARLGYAVAHAIDPNAPVVEVMSNGLQEMVGQIAQALIAAKNPVIVSGASCGHAGIVRAAGAVTKALYAHKLKAGIFLTVPECNSLGIAMMGGGSLEEAAERLASGDADTVVIVENDLHQRAEQPLIERILSSAKRVVVIDHTMNDTTASADWVLPAATYADGDGTLVNNEGRAQRYFQVYVPEHGTREAWRWLLDAESIDQVQTAMAEALPPLAAVSDTAPPADARFVDQRLVRKSHRYTGWTAMHAGKDVHEPYAAPDPDSPFTFSLEGYRGPVPGSVRNSTWTPGWNSPQGISKFQDEVGGPLRGGDPGVRLIEPEQTQSEYDSPPLPSARREGEYEAVPICHVFGSEELSARAPAIAQRVRPAYIGLNPEDAAALGLSKGEAASLTVGDTECALPVEIIETLSRGMVGLPIGLPGVPVLSLPTPASVRKARP